MKIKRMFSLMLSLVFFTLVACEGANTNSSTSGTINDVNNTNQSSENGTDDVDGDKLSIYTSFYPMYYFTTLIAGDTADVKNIMPAGADSHDYEPSASIIAEVLGADALIYQGAGMEFWIDKVKATVEAENDDIKIVEAAKGISLLESSHSHDHNHDEDTDHSHDDHDEHDHDHDEHDHDHEHGALTLEDIPEEYRELTPVKLSKHGDHWHLFYEDGSEIGVHGDPRELYPDVETEEYDEAHGHDDHDHDPDHDEDADHSHDDHDHDHDDHDHDHAHDHQYDPHVWLSIKRSIQMLENIHEALVELNPEAKELYDANLETAKKDFEELDASFAAKIKESKLEYFIINHEAFGYLADDYGITQVGITGVGTEQDPNPALMKDLVNFAKEHHIHTIFYDDAGSDKVSQTLAREIGGEVQALTTIHAPSEEDIAKGIDYRSLMERNLQSLLASIE